jgi:S-adenosylmethionine/arginine decarboxylase-like enzyme
MPWGYHLAVNAARCCPRSIRNADHITSFTHALVNRIRMVPFGDPQVVHFGIDNKAGYTLVQLIQTSNICAHFVEETNDIYLDVFSCKDFKEEDVRAVVSDYFKPGRIDARLLIRDVDTPLK